MERTVIAIILLMVSTFTLSADIISEERFTQIYVEHVEKGRSDVEGTITAPLKVIFRHSDGSDSEVFLDNAYLQYSAEPSTLNEIIDIYVESFFQGYINIDLTRTQTNLLPVVKSNSYLEEVRGMSGAGAKDFEPLFERLNDELIIMFVFDSPKSMSLASHDDIDSLGIQVEELRDIAINNLRSKLPDITRQGSQSLFMLAAGGSYEASLLLLDEIWNPDNFGLKGEIVVFLPARDVLLVTSSESMQGIQQAKQIVDSNEWSYFISGDAFIRKNENWVKSDVD